MSAVTNPNASRLYVSIRNFFFSFMFTLFVQWKWRLWTGFKATSRFRIYLRQPRFIFIQSIKYFSLNLKANKPLSLPDSPISTFKHTTLTPNEVTWCLNACKPRHRGNWRNMPQLMDELRWSLWRRTPQGALRNLCFLCSGFETPSQHFRRPWGRH